MIGTLKGTIMIQNFQGKRKSLKPTISYSCIASAERIIALMNTALFIPPYISQYNKEYML